MCKDFSMREKESVRFGYGENTMLYEIALYEPDEYRERATQLEKDAHKLSNLINSKITVFKLILTIPAISRLGAVRLQTELDVLFSNLAFWLIS